MTPITIFNNLENVYGEIKLITRNYPTGKFTLKPNIPVRNGDLFQFNARFQTGGSNVYISSDDGYTVNAADDFKDDNATFVTNNVAINDVLWIEGGIHEGYYRIWKIDSQTQVSVCKKVFLSDIDGYTTISTDDFKDDSTDAFADVLVGDIIYIEEGSDIGWYVVGTKDSNNQLSLTGLSATASEANLVYSIYKKVVFTSTTSLDYEIWTEMIYKGRVVNKNFEKVRSISTESEAEELDKILPQKSVCGTFAGLLTDIMENANFLWMALSNSTPFHYRAPHSFRNDDNGTEPNGWIPTTGAGSTIQVIASQSGHAKVVELHTGSGATNCYIGRAYTPVNGVWEGYVEIDRTTSRFHIWYNDGNYKIIVSPPEPDDGFYGLYDVKFDSDGYIKALDDENFVNLQAYSADTVYYIQIEYDIETGDYYVTIDEGTKHGPYNTDGPVKVGSFGIGHFALDGAGVFNAYVDAVGDTGEGNYIREWNKKKEYDELTYDTVFKRYDLAGDVSLREAINQYADHYYQTWYITPSYELLINDGAVDSGLDFDSNSNIQRLVGKQQVKEYNYVLLMGGIVNNVQISASAGTGDTVYKDTYARIKDIIDLQNLAIEIKNREGENPLSIAFWYKDAEIGAIQVGEEGTVIADTLRFRKSEEYVCTTNTQFKIRAEKLILKEERVLRMELFMDDVLIFKRNIQEETKHDTQSNTVLANQAAGSGVAGGGEINSGQNVGVGGVGIYKNKSGVFLNFKNINAASSKITITDDTDNEEIDIDIVPSELFENPPIEDEANKAPTSEWAFDHKANINAHHNQSHNHDSEYYTETEIDNRVFTSGASFPGSPIEGDLHWDTGDEAWYRRDSVAQAWIQIGAAGAGSYGALTLEQVRSNSNQIAGEIDMNQNKIIDLPNPTSDNDIVRKIYVDDEASHGVASNDLIHSNDTERYATATVPVKLKEIKIYHSLKLRVYWEMKSNNSSYTARSRVYINGSAVGSIHASTSETYLSYTEDVTVNAGDLLQIYGWISTILERCYIRYMRIKFVEYVNTAGY